jgi:hypothetical protein
VTQKRPPYLGVRGSRLWRRVTTDFELDAAEAEVLTETCRTVDLLEALQSEFAGSPLTVEGSTGQPRINPLVETLAIVRNLLGRQVRQPGLPDIDASAPMPDQLASRRSRAG